MLDLVQFAKERRDGIGAQQYGPWEMKSFLKSGRDPLREGDEELADAVNYNDLLIPAGLLPEEAWDLIHDWQRRLHAIYAERHEAIEAYKLGGGG